MPTRKKKPTKSVSKKRVAPEDNPVVTWMVVAFTLLSIVFAYISYLHYG